MFRKILSIALAALMLAGLCMAFGSCSKTDDSFKIGVILLHDEKSTYDLNFINGVKAAAKELGLKDSQIIFKRNIKESNDCYVAASELVDEGCSVVFADSFGHEDYIIKAAKEFKNVQFCHATGTKAHTTTDAPNFHNAFASIYEGRYLAGVAAGLKLNEMIENGTEIKGVKVTADNAKIGYVGAFTYAEVISGYTSFYLGAKSVCPTVTMDVQFTGSWYDETAEKNTALSLIEGGCKLISGHADSMGAPTACEEQGVPNIAYNGSTVDKCPNTFIVSSRIDWAPYFKYICEQAMAGKTIDTDWTGTLNTGSVALTDINEKVAAKGTKAKLDEVKAKLISGEIKVFDTSTFTVDGKTVESFMADVDTDDSFTPDKEVVKDGAVLESYYRSAPYFTLQIDGITLLNNKT